ncbi:uncharacterized protein MELLADRAFT_106474 [Melampsora larici-populina 98AG31]|uniref:Uncharacterized protein n=1 Tax=Melampsora larici-populina (strain 98AG31 / pathotype 3-4-7) TaxID=747676 RepID=F4RLM0_MELLP|nr:uncharacterized protein MELLADRAFT_106474 [Melampsora larici-populina 98AG31]EGG06725.1 hypothetical protein MELLADRAFT_106474 [Melampsora larici-populina 98AG31]
MNDEKEANKAMWIQHEVFPDQPPIFLYEFPSCPSHHLVYLAQINIQGDEMGSIVGNPSIFVRDAYVKFCHFPPTIPISPTKTAYNPGKASSHPDEPKHKKP